MSKSMKAVGFAIGASMIWASVGLVLRSIEISAVHFLFLSSLFSLLAGTVFLILTGQHKYLKEVKLSKTMIIFTFFQTLLVLVNFQAFLDPLVQTSAVILITNAIPILIVFLAPLLIKENSTKFEFVFSFIGMIGLIIFVYGQGSQGISFRVSIGLILALIALFINGIVSILNRKVSQQVPSVLMPVIVASGNFLFSLPLALKDAPVLLNIDLKSYLLTAVMGMFGGMLCFLFIAKAYSQLKVQIVSIILLSQVIFAGVLGYIFLDEKFSALMLLGTIIIMGANVGVVLLKK